MTRDWLRYHLHMATRHAWKMRLSLARGRTGAAAYHEYNCYRHWHCAEASLSDAGRAGMLAQDEVRP